MQLTVPGTSSAGRVRLLPCRLMYPISPAKPARSHSRKRASSGARSMFATPMRAKPSSAAQARMSASRAAGSSGAGLALSGAFATGHAGKANRSRPYNGQHSRICPTVDAQVAWQSSRSNLHFPTLRRPRPSASPRSNIPRRRASERRRCISRAIWARARPLACARFLRACGVSGLIRSPDLHPRGNLSTRRAHPAAHLRACRSVSTRRRRASGGAGPAGLSDGWTLAAGRVAAKSRGLAAAARS